MKLSDCCQGKPQTIVNEEGLSFCSVCGNWVSFTAYGEDEEPDDYSALEDKFRQFRDRVSSVMAFYANPSHYIVGIKEERSLIEMDQGRNARDMIQKTEAEFDADTSDDLL